MLTAVRSGDARGAMGGDVDLEAGEWRVPASRTKAGAEHRAPFSDAVVAVLEGMMAHSDGAADSLIFPSVGGRRLNGDTLIKDEGHREVHTRLRTLDNIRVSRTRVLRTRRSSDRRPRRSRPSRRRRSTHQREAALRGAGIFELPFPPDRAMLE